MKHKSYLSIVRQIFFQRLRRNHFSKQIKHRGRIQVAQNQNFVLVIVFHNFGQKLAKKSKRDFLTRSTASLHTTCCGSCWIVYRVFNLEIRARNGNLLVTWRGLVFRIQERIYDFWGAACVEREFFKKECLFFAIDGLAIKLKSHDYIAEAS